LVRTAPRCGHGSSLDPAIHALLAVRLGDLALARRYFRQAAEIDLANNMGNAAGGVHVGALGNLWQATIMGVAGMQLRNDGLFFDPHLLPVWKSLRFPIQWRGRWLEISLSADPTAIDVTLNRGEPLAVTLRGEGRRVILQERKRYRAELAAGQWGRWEDRSL
jgi:kojibiose phosphorylase